VWRTTTESKLVLDKRPSLHILRIVRSMTLQWVRFIELQKPSHRRQHFYHLLKFAPLERCGHFEGKFFLGYGRTNSMITTIEISQKSWNLCKEAKSGRNDNELEIDAFWVPRNVNGPDRFPNRPRLIWKQSVLDCSVSWDIPIA